MRKYIIPLLVVLSIIILIAMRPQLRTNASPESITLSLSESPQATIATSLSYKGWFDFGFSFIGGTLSVTPRTSPFTVGPATRTTTLAVPDAYFTVTAVATGTGTFIVSGTSVEGGHPNKTINVTVVP